MSSCEDNLRTSAQRWGERKIGEFSKQLEKGAGRPKKNSPHHAENFKANTLKEVGITSQVASRCEAMADIPKDVFEDYLHISPDLTACFVLSSPWSRIVRTRLTVSLEVPIISATFSADFTIGAVAPFFFPFFLLSTIS